MWCGLWVVAVVAFGLAHFASRRTRQIGITALIASPVIFLTIGLAFVPPTPPTYLIEWPRAMLMAMPILVAWAALSAVGYFAGRWSVR
jgi:hypothetical protein